MCIWLPYIALFFYWPSYFLNICTHETFFKRVHSLFSTLHSSLAILFRVWIFFVVDMFEIFAQWKNPGRYWTKSTKRSFLSSVWLALLKTLTEELRLQTIFTGCENKNDHLQVVDSAGPKYDQQHLWLRGWLKASWVSSKCTKHCWRARANGKVYNDNSSLAAPPVWI